MAGAVVTMTTVGYGDETPHLLGGKLVAVFLACTGILIYGYLGAVERILLCAST